MVLREGARKVYEKPSTIVSGPVKFALKLLGIVLFIAVLIFGSIFVYNLVASGTMGGFTQKAITSISNSVIGPVLKSIGVQGIEYYSHPEKIGSDPWKSRVDATEKEKIGVEFGQLRTVEYEYTYNEEGNLPDIEADSSVMVTGISDMDLEFNCVLQKGVVGGERIEGKAEPSEVSLEAENGFFSELFPVTCKYSELKDIGKNPTLYLSTTYATKTEAYNTIYFMPWEKVNEYHKRGVYGMDIFNSENIEDPDLYLLENNVVNAKTVNIDSPIKIKLEGSYSLPLSEGSQYGREFYRYKVDLEKEMSWNGYPKELKSLVIMLPDYFEVNENADFYDTGEQTDYGYRIYKLKEEKLKNTNEECSAVDIFLLSEECINKWEDGIPNKFVLEFRVGDLKKQEIYSEFINIEAEYVVEDYVRGYVRIREETT